MTTWDHLVAQKEADERNLPVCECCKEPVYPFEDLSSNIEAVLEIENRFSDEPFDVNECRPCSLGCLNDAVLVEGRVRMVGACKRDKGNLAELPEPTQINQARMAL